MEEIVEQLQLLNKKDIIDVIGILVPILLSIIIIIQNIVYFRKTKSFQKKLHKDDYKLKLHDDILRIYGTYYEFRDVIEGSGFAKNVRTGQVILATEQAKQLLNLRNTITKNLDLARLLFCQEDNELFSVVEESTDLQLEIIKKYLKYIYSGKLQEVTNRAWNSCYNSNSSLIRNYDYKVLYTNEDLYNYFLNLCESEEIKEIEKLKIECEKYHLYENFDIHFKKYFTLKEQ